VSLRNRLPPFSNQKSCTRSFQSSHRTRNQFRRKAVLISHAGFQCWPQSKARGRIQGLYTRIQLSAFAACRCGITGDFGISLASALRATRSTSTYQIHPASSLSNLSRLHRRLCADAHQVLWSQAKDEAFRVDRYLGKEQKGIRALGYVENPPPSLAVEIILTHYRKMLHIAFPP
jgi:hypothetical protein